MKKNILIGLLVGFVLLGIFFFFQSQNQTIFNKDLESCMNIPVSNDAREGFTCIRNISIIYGNVEFCNKIREYAVNEYTETNYDICKSEVKVFSQLKDEAEKCEDLPGKIISSGLQIDINYKEPACITAIAVKYKDDKFCSYIRPSGGSLGWGDGRECTLQAYIAIANISNCGRLRHYSDKCEEEILKKIT